MIGALHQTYHFLNAVPDFLNAVPEIPEINISGTAFKK
jgi:hypothetical protein